MIRHIVLLDLLPDGDGVELAAVMAGLAGLRDHLTGFVHFEHGPNRDFEGMSPNCAYAFICHFDDKDTSRAYINDPTHQALGQRLVALCRGGVAGITVVDMAIAA